jgi:magnesium-transporting ATPase (P-type)
VVNIFITIVIFSLLVIPIILMYQLTNTAAHGDDGSTNSRNGNNRDMFQAVGVLMVFTLLFSTAMSLLTKAARHELFAASAAYCAILVVFIGNLTAPGN